MKYVYNDKYIVNGIVCYDGFFCFGEDNCWGLFYFGFLGWRIGVESFFENVIWLEELKLCVFYGIIGNFVIGDFVVFFEFGIRG